MTLSRALIYNGRSASQSQFRLRVDDTVQVVPMINARDSVKTWRSRVLNDTLFLRADYRTHRFDRHFHEEYAIGVIDGGCQAFSYDRDRRLDMPRGSVALISPGIVHTGWPGSEQGWTYRMLYPSAATLGEVVQDIFGASDVVFFHRPVVEDPVLFAQLVALHTAAEDPAADALHVETLYLSAVRFAIVSHAGRTDRAALVLHPPAMRRVRDTLESRYDEAVTLNQLRDVAGLSKFHLLRQFKATFGLPPHAYLRQVRVRRAHEMILRGRDLAQTAAAVGFADQAHMTRAFRRTLGYTPGALAMSRV